LAIDGECIGKTLSTPIPSTTFLTVIVAEIPLPCFLAIITPSKIWILSLSPSLIFWCTLIVSPGLISGKLFSCSLLNCSNNVVIFFIYCLAKLFIICCNSSGSSEVNSFTWSEGNWILSCCACRNCLVNPSGIGDFLKQDPELRFSFRSAARDFQLIDEAKKVLDEAYALDIENNDWPKQFIENPFDIIICAEFIEHLFDQEKFLSIIIYVLKSLCL